MIYNKINGIHSCNDLVQIMEMMDNKKIIIIFSFILTIEGIGVNIYHADTGSYKTFNSHARDKYGRSHPSGTCVLLEVPSIHSLVQYFQTIINTHLMTLINSEECRLIHMK